MTGTTEGKVREWDQPCPSCQGEGVDDSGPYDVHTLPCTCHPALVKLREMEGDLYAANARAREAEQYRNGHLPTCGGMDEAAGRCECGYLQGEAYRGLMDRLDEQDKELARLRREMEGVRAENEALKKDAAEHCEALTIAHGIGYASRNDEMLALVKERDELRARVGEVEKEREFLRKRAREMRRKPTKAEAALWRLLSKDVEWSRQIPLLGMYIADFIHDSLGLVVEADGGYHDDPIQAAKDASRDRVMASMQYDCIRFTNKQILTQPRWVMAAIAARLNVRRKLKGLPIVPYRPGPEPVIPVGRSRRGTYRDFGARKYD